MKKLKFTTLLSQDDLVNIFCQGYLYEMNSFHVIEKPTKTYDTFRSRGSFLDESKFIYSKFKSGHTIIVKNIEYLNDNIKDICYELGPHTNVHLYLVPKNGVTSFEFHQDNRDVLICMVYGRKIFYLKDDKNLTTEYHLGPGDQLSIKKGVWHKAQPIGGSCLLSFGTEPIEDYAVPSSFCKDDFL